MGSPGQHSAVWIGLIISAIGVTVTILGLRISRQNAALAEEVNRPLLQYDQIVAKILRYNDFRIGVPATNIGATTSVIDSSEVYLLPFLPEYYDNHQMTACRESIHIAPLLAGEPTSLGTLGALEPHMRTEVNQWFQAGQACEGLRFPLGVTVTLKYHSSVTNRTYEQTTPATVTLMFRTKEHFKDPD